MKLISIEFTLPVSVVLTAALGLPGMASKPAEGGAGTPSALQPSTQSDATKCGLVQAVTAKPDGYGTWTMDCSRKVQSCEYTYTTKDGGKASQTIIIFYADKDRSGWAYFYNAANKPWARCAVPGNPKYDAKAMCWELLKGDGTGYEPFKDGAGKPQSIGYCPAPKDGKSPIPLLPLPPK